MATSTVLWKLNCDDSDFILKKSESPLTWRFRGTNTQFCQTTMARYIRVPTHRPNYVPEGVSA